MIDYMASLERLTARIEDLYFSGHGPENPGRSALCAVS